MSEPKARGLALMEVVLAFGILGLALLTFLNVFSIALKYHRQSLNSASAAAVAHTIMSRNLASIRSDLPAGAKDAFWSGTYPYPSTPYSTGQLKVGREEFSYAIYGVDVPGVGDANATSPNILRQIETYVWWTEPGQPGQQRVYLSRLISRGEQP